MENTRKATRLETEVLEYLNELRESGDTNMFGASPYVQEMFGINRRSANDLVALWMENFNEESNYETVKA